MLNRWLPGFLVFTIFSSFTILCPPLASAGQPKERLALMLTGSDCRGAQQTLVTALQQTDGVFAVDSDSVPGHLLIDVEEGKTSTQDILTIVYTAIGTPLSCRVEIMQSCITAPKRTEITAPAK